VSALQLLCRPGFEGECAAEITERAGALGIQGYARARAGEGRLSYHPGDAQQAGTLHAALDAESLIFPRQAWLRLGELDGLTAGHRVEPILEGLRAGPDTPQALVIETCDTNTGRALTGLARGLERPLREALGLPKTDPPAVASARVLLLESSRVILGHALPGRAAPWPGGVPRMRVPASAPSRSARKLEEALLRLVPEAARPHAGQTGVDLGAAPGGWSWVLHRRGVEVTAIDNGALAPELAQRPGLEHLRADAFHYRPPRPVHWLVCDLAQPPARVCALIEDWLQAGLCAQALVNLKLPMKQRYAAVTEALTRLRAAAGPGRVLRCKQLYHDREEVTLYIGPAPD
jgi:23S rRNA (cytidine2498-2'-O)-methyltransferase